VRALSWFNPKPPDLSLRVPKHVPKRVVPSEIGADGLVLNYLMHHGSGRMLRDYSGNRFHGSINACEWLDGSWGWGLTFNGSSYVDVPTGASLANLTNWTVMAWVIPQTVHVGTIYGEANTTTDTPLLAIQLTDWPPGDRLRVAHRDDGGTIIGLNLGTYSAGERFHLAVTKEGDVYTIYKNGVSLGSGSQTIGATTIDNIKLGVLRRTSPTDYFQGLCTLLLTFSRTLPPSEINLYFQRTRSLFEI